MILTPARPTEKYIRGRIAFHESQARYLAEHDQMELARWAHSVAEEWRKKLPLPITAGSSPGEPPPGETK